MNACKTASHRSSRMAATSALLLAIASSAAASEIGHFNGGFLNIRDYYLPPPGVYGSLYNYFYTTHRMNDASGDKIDDVTVTPGGGTPVTLDVDVDVDMFITAPGIIWVPDFTILGARYGVLVTLPFANSSLNAGVSTATGRGGDIEAGDFNIGDMLIQPLWLDWGLKHWDFTFAWGVYFPTGKYDTENFGLPGGQTVEVEDSDNIGYGFWTNHFQSAIAWYPRADRSTAVTSALTFEANSKKDDFDIRPGNTLSLTYGVSQYLPLKKDHTLLLELGLAGYDHWQVSDDHGDDVASDTRDQLHGIGAQVGTTYVPWDFVVNSHYFYEYYAEDRFQGHAFGISFAKKFWGPKKADNATPEDKQARHWAMKQ